MFWRKSKKIKELEERLTEIEHSLCPNSSHDWKLIDRYYVLDDVVDGNPFEHIEEVYKCTKCKKTTIERDYYI